MSPDSKQQQTLQVPNLNSRHTMDSIISLHAICWIFHQPSICEEPIGSVAEDTLPASTYCTSSGQGRYLESPVPLCRTLMIDKQVSKPAGSRHTPCSGLHLLPQPHKCIK